MRKFLSIERNFLITRPDCSIALKNGKKLSNIPKFSVKHIDFSEDTG